ncbi:hypothetical protein QE152_g30812 [Popillia japonica]|uniref:GATA zinc finger domain-containing protein 1 n=1 Tax=Popillia japonica TaxID=7064 RepID=A0AAW1JD44_POPJA
MPLRGNPECLKCDCVNEAKDECKSDDENDENKDEKSRKRTRTTRSYKTRLNPFALPKVAAPKGRGRRALAKRIPIKAPSGVSTPVTSDYIFYKEKYFQIGDIVSMVDGENDVYYAQLRGFLTDQYCEKSAIITWLLPTTDSPPPNEMFDPATYIIGPDEDIPRKLECMEFVMHAPSDYYKASNTPYPNVHPAAEPGFIWSSLKPIQRLWCQTT